MGILNIGFGNIVNTDKIVAIINPDSAPAKRIIQKAKEEECLVDATQGRRTKSVLITDGDRIILSALQPETLAGRFSGISAREGKDAVRGPETAPQKPDDFNKGRPVQ